MNIKVLGACCAACNATFENIRQAAVQVDKNIEVVQVDNVLDILKYRIMQTPAVVMDEVVVSVGKTLNLSEAKKLIEQNKAFSITNFL
jgi:hypothetical protein